MSEEMSKEDLEYLLNKAKNHQDFKHPEPFKQCKWVTRDGSKEYFDNISSNKSGIMQTIMKNKTGDPKSCLNGKVKGLYFSPAVDYKTGEPLSNSPFGDHRFKVRAEFFFNEETNLYFADFYCKDQKKKNVNHFVTLVLARDGSEQDNFCKEKLIKLNPYNNQFFKKKQSEICNCILEEPGSQKLESQGSPATKKRQNIKSELDSELLDKQTIPGHSSDEDTHTGLSPAVSEMSLPDIAPSLTRIKSKYEEKTKVKPGTSRLPPVRKRFSRSESVPDTKKTKIDDSAVLVYEKKTKVKPGTSAVSGSCTKETTTSFDRTISHQRPNYEVFTTTKLWVEIFYLHNINMDEWMRHGALFGNVNEKRSKTAMKLRGRPKTPECKICSLKYRQSGAYKVIFKLNTNVAAKRRHRDADGVERSGAGWCPHLLLMSQKRRLLVNSNESAAGVDFCKICNESNESTGLATFEINESELKLVSLEIFQDIEIYT